MNWLWETGDGKSLEGLKNQRKLDKMILNEKFFNERFVKGIHWPEPPSYKEHTDLLLGKYNPDIEHSYWKLWQERKYWIKKDKLYLNEVESNDK